MTFYERFFKMPVPERKRIADESQLSLPYILKQVYTRGRNPMFRFHNAVALDRASKGELPFFMFSEGTTEIDWDYVAKRLRQAKRKGLIGRAPAKVEKESANAGA